MIRLHYVTCPFSTKTFFDDSAMLVWNFKKGDLVKKGDVLGEIETLKAIIDIDAPASGKFTPTVDEGMIDEEKGNILGFIEVED